MKMRKCLTAEATHLIKMFASHETTVEAGW